VEIYNLATARFAGFKPATVDEVLRRYAAKDFEAATRLYAEQDGRIVAYTSFAMNGRLSVPWCRPGTSDVPSVLMQATLDRMRGRGLKRAWAAYRADWLEVQRLLEWFGFRRDAEVINFVANIAELPREILLEGCTVEGARSELARDILQLDPLAFGVADPEELAAAWWNSPYLSGHEIFAARRMGRLLGVGIAVINPSYADPTRVDAAMPCFRLGAIGTESERTKRINGLFSYVAPAGANNQQIGQLLLGEACRRLTQAGLRHVAAQCRSDRPAVAFYRRLFQVQGSFPIFVREL
jgi:GNAT superfamily N-acetyltransferase